LPPLSVIFLFACRAFDWSPLADKFIVPPVITIELSHVIPATLAPLLWVLMLPPDISIIPLSPSMASPVAVTDKVPLVKTKPSFACSPSLAAPLIVIVPPSIRISSSLHKPCWTEPLPLMVKLPEPLKISVPSLKTAASCSSTAPASVTSESGEEAPSVSIFVVLAARVSVVFLLA